MDNLKQEEHNKEANNQEDQLTEEAYFEVDSDNIVEELIRKVVKGYEDAYNKNNDKNEIKFSMTISNHKVPTPDGNKAVAYLRLERSIREKGIWPKLVPDPDETKPPIYEEGWESKILHQEVYFFKSMQERLNPEAPWKQTLYLSCLARLISAGLEYAELLHRLKPAKEALAKKANQTPEDETQERLNKIGLVGAKEQPKPLTPAEEKYKDWVKQNSEYGK